MLLMTNNQLHLKRNHYNDYPLRLYIYYHPANTP